MTNDRRMVPAGPSDEEIERFIITNWLEGKPPVTAEWMRAMVKFVRQVLARWGAQTEYDAHEARNAIGLHDVIQEHMTPDLFPIPDTSVLGQDAFFVRELLAAVRSSSRPKGRVVEGVACLDTRGNPTQVTFDIAASKIDEVCRELNPANGRVRFAHACVEILDAPEEGR